MGTSISRIGELIAAAPHMVNDHVIVTLWDQYRNDNDFALQLLKVPALPTAVHADIGTLRSASVKAHWLKHPMTTRQQLVGAVENETRVSVLAAAARSEVVPVELADRLFQTAVELSQVGLFEALLANDNVPARIRGAALAHIPGLSKRLGDTEARLFARFPEAAESYVAAWDPNPHVPNNDILAAAIDHIVDVDVAVTVVQDAFERAVPSVNDAIKAVRRSPIGHLLTTLGYRFGAAVSLLAALASPEMVGNARFDDLAAKFDVVTRLAEEATAATGDYVAVKRSIALFERVRQNFESYDSSGVTELFARGDDVSAADLREFVEGPLNRGALCSWPLLAVVAHKACDVEVLRTAVSARSWSTIRMSSSFAARVGRRNHDKFEFLAGVLSRTPYLEWENVLDSWEYSGSPFDRFDVVAESLAKWRQSAFVAPTTIVEDMGAPPVVVAALSFNDVVADGGAIFGELPKVAACIADLMGGQPAEAWLALMTLADSVPDDALLGDVLDTAKHLVVA